MERNEEGLQLLGSATKYRMDYAPEVLETANTITIYYTRRDFSLFTLMLMAVFG